MTGKTTASMVLVATLALGFAAFAYGADENEEQAALAAQAAELAPDSMPDAQRIVALHRFVRDEILQVKTQYG